MRWILLVAGIALSAAIRVAPVVGEVPSAAPAPDRPPLQIALFGVAVEAHAGYVRVSEVVDLRNPTERPVFEDVALPLPPGARYVTFHEGLQRPRVEADRIVDRLIVRPGTLRVTYAYSVAGVGEIVLDHKWSVPIERVEVLATAPALVRSPRLETVPPVVAEGRTYTRASAHDLRPGTLALTVTGVPAPSRWRAPAAAGTLGSLLVLGLLWAVVRTGRGTNR